MLSSAKRGQGAAGAAILLAIIAAVMIMFILFLPPQERAEILGENYTGSGSGSSIENRPVLENLLTVSPGKVDYLAQDEIEHPLPVVNIYTRTEGKVIAEKNVIRLKNGVFSEENDEFSFKIADLSNTENVLLDFTPTLVEGRIIVKLNGEKVYDSNPADTPLPISLSKANLKESNLLKFSVSSPGLAFWATNEALLEELKIIADVTDVSAQFSKNIFLVSETERRNMEKGILKFKPDCYFAEVGRLKITVNGQELYNGIPDCDLSIVPIEFSPDILHQGENEILFHTEKGTYILSHVNMVSKLKEVDFPTYYFELSNEQYEQVINEERRLRLTLDFVDSVSSKTGEILFNGHVHGFDTKEVFETLDLSIDVVRGNNAIKLRPRRTLEIRSLKVDLVK